MVLSAETYRRIVSEDTNGTWELVDGRLREKPALSFQHHDTSFFLGFLLQGQLDRASFRVHVNGSRLERNERNYFVPDIAVIPVELFGPLQAIPNALNLYVQPLPLVVEVWSPSTGTYDGDEKSHNTWREGTRRFGASTRTKRHSKPGVASQTAPTSNHFIETTPSSPPSFPMSRSIWLRSLSSH